MAGNAQPDERAEISQKALRREISPEQADRAISEIDRRSVLTPEARALMGGKAPAAQAGQPKRLRYNPATGRIE